MKIATERCEAMLWWLLLILPLTAATLCRSGQQFWNGTLEKCVDCSKCPQEGHVVLRPCQVHQDTVCGPLSALDIDWSFMREKKHHHSEEQVLTERTSLYSSEDKSQWKKPHHHNHKKSHHHHGHNKTKHHHKTKNSSVPESASQLREVVNLTVSAAATAPFSAAEELVWDWQAVALALAVFACLLFFLVACIYSVHHARQWRRLKDHFEDFEADVGELSTRLSLLLPALHGEDTGATMQQEECCSSNGQCLYLEKLLARKRQEEVCGERGNVYIDREMTVIQPTK